jgi:hypothetical protein
MIPFKKSENLKFSLRFSQSNEERAVKGGIYYSHLHTLAEIAETGKQRFQRCSSQRPPAATFSPA